MEPAFKMAYRRLTYLFIKEENRDFQKLVVFLEVQGILEAEEAKGYALATTTKTQRLEGGVTDAGTPV
ncbi:hypothetical protein F2Q68_00030571 [Brassica cretica]|uniref:Uncharacterized protein n=1 Tax=Brassica cretica TaxID=69181 RepID=A0A8S9G7P4_BRACR|nr:hypothetical protein F2Q68_00030571 [Brassica cretica]